MSASLTLQASNGTVDARAGWPSKWPIDFCPAIFACNDNPLPGTPLFNAKTPTGLTAQLILCGTVGTLCFLLFCFLRVRWTAMYSPRLRMKKHAPETLPSSFFGWIIPLIRIPHSVVLEKVGLDAVVLLQFLLMGAKLFGLCGFFGTVVLLPISRMGGDLANSTDPETPEDEQAAVYSPSYLWVYLFFTYFFCFATFYFTFVNYRDYVRIRREFLLRTAKTLPARTILVTGIPPNLRSDRKLAEYFEQLGIGVVESVHIIRHVNRLLDYIKERAQYLQLLERAYARYWGNPCTDTTYDPDALLRDAEQDQSIRAIDWYGNSQSLPTHAKPRNRPKSKTGFLGLFGKTVDAIEYYTEQFNEIDNLVMRARKFGKFLPTSVGFVTFEHSVSACIASQVLIDSTPFRVQAELAPEPRNVLWENIAMHNRERMIRKGVILCILIFFVFFWVIPISYFSALTSVNSLRNYFPWLMNLASKNKILQQIVQGFLPTLGVVIFMAILPLIVGVLSAMEGFQTRSEAEESSFSKHFFFLLFNVLLVFTVSSTLFKTLTSMIEDPKQIANILAATLPQVAPFFVNYTVLHGVMLLPIQLLQIGPIILNTFWRIFFCKTPRDYAEVSAPRMFNYGWGYPTPVFLFVVLLVYSTSAPIILVFGTFYYLLAYIVFKYQLLYVYFHPYEVAGRMWPKVFSRLIVGLLLFELMSVGLFALKKAYPLAVLCVPLIVLTILFKITVDAAYLRSTRFLPLQLLTQRLGAPDTVATPLAVPNPQPSTSDRSVRAVDGGHKVQLRRRRTVLDQDDYNAEPTTHTDFKQPPMTLVPGILNTGMKRYGHPALLGALPQLWLPVPDKKFRQHPQEQANGQKPAATSLPINAARDNGRLPGNSMVESPSDMSPTLYNGNRRLTGERQPLLSVSPDGAIPRDLIRIPEDEGSSFDSSSSEDEGHARATYYHHPERRYSRIVLGTSSNTRSYGAV